MRLDRSTLFGIVIGALLISGAIILGPGHGAFWNLPSVVIVVGGVGATTLIRFPAPIVLGSAKVVQQAFLNRSGSPAELVTTLVRMADLVRRDSLLVLEREPVRDPFLRRGIELCVDGVDPGAVETVLRTESASISERHERGQRILRSMGTSAPSFGMIGTLIGLVQMLSRLDDPSKIGSAMALAMLTTLYGALLAYLVFLPLADKLAERSRQELLNREIVVHGLMAILSGYHPRVVEGRLLGLLEPGFRPQRIGRARRGRTAA
jgi:chemotaxis protein MotA